MGCGQVEILVVRDLYMKPVKIQLLMLELTASTDFPPPQLEVGNHPFGCFKCKHVPEPDGRMVQTPLTSFLPPADRRLVLE